MRLLHTSDWHLGRSFHGVGLLDAQATYLEHLVQVVRSERVDAVLVSGDVYDRALPPPDAVRVLDEAVTRLSELTQVVISSGNHDSATRLGFGAGVLERSGVHVRTSLASIGRPVQVADGVIYPLPYLEPSLTAEPLAAAERTHAGVLRAAMQRVRADLTSRTGPSVVMAHAFVTGATSSDSERDIAVGGVAAVPAEVFDGISYAALGHLHRPQAVTDSVRFSGSPLAMSFSETGQVKESVLVEATVAGLRTTSIAAPVPRPLARLRGELADLLSDPAYGEAEQSWCEVTLTDASRPAGAMEQLRRRFPHTLVLAFDAPVGSRSIGSYATRVRDRADLDVCCDFLDHVRGRDAADDERALFEIALEQTRTDRARRDDEGQVGAA
ncbi:exonuclease SbcCD subunit D [Calidifontibacter sp. DB0510]|uniref:Nuclease SbcCD subunit D n=1 Tax=Metallococcus carri TaxID=1656884 RepID=A0A967EG76_9MICO|nr:exonuclease SbcCD subunit D [Metallococcus carri]NHN54723.1 exonuclease SbcCD subunit D [Metallococcus carri]NOP37068.1 exonuclease SbcCD subunit D [Calidifontibacter sp. DB2511S]